ncbi:PepSY domain-containing protein [Paenalkalicoccus suaedae]|uniref:PepSY domain-containing protein n=1 Tax=Paenalkalicoccus suaedae TaxID=2592382 RepID=A0A859FBN0_9BACI|nr:PepSY domain-containing protein [Paenalkalicoccus suaedae]QKS70121.1 PepSY domain-containing protein [Paenalkalicoccus suaedae]
MRKAILALVGVTVIGGTSAYAITSDGTRTASLTPELIVEETELPAAEVDTNTNTNTSNSEQAVTQSTSNEQSNEQPTAEGERLTEEQAIEIAQTIVNGQLDEIELDTENGRLVYEVELDFEGDDYEIYVDAYTGDIVKVDDNLLGTPLAQEMAISLEEAESIALNLFDGGKIDDRELERRGEQYYYELEVELRDEDGDVYIDAMTGEVIKVEDDIRPYLLSANNATQTNNQEQNKGSESNQVQENEQSSSHATEPTMISHEQAKEIAVNHVGKGKVDDIDLERENGHVYYEVEVEWSDDDADVYVDAFTGEVLHVDY